MQRETKLAIVVTIKILKVIAFERKIKKIVIVKAYIKEIGNNAIKLLKYLLIEADNIPMLQEVM